MEEKEEEYEIFLFSVQKCTNREQNHDNFFEFIFAINELHAFNSLQFQYQIEGNGKMYRNV